MEFRLEGTNSFEFSRSDLEKRLNVVLKYLSDVQILLPDSYSGYGIHVNYRLIAKTKSVFPYIRTEQLVQTKEAVRMRSVNDAQKDGSSDSAELYISKNDINDFDGLLCSVVQVFVFDIVESRFCA